jgi:hypothetical protein
MFHETASSESTEYRLPDRVMRGHDGAIAAERHLKHHRLK